MLTYVVWLILIGSLASLPDDAVVFCTNTGGSVDMRWRVPNPGSSGTVVIVGPSDKEVLECHGGSVSVASGYRERVRGESAAEGQIQLELMQVRPTDAGFYVCKEGSTGGNLIENCKQQLCYIEIDQPRVHKKGFELEGNDVMLSCIGKLPYPLLDLGLRFSFEWFKNGVPLKEKGQHLTRANLTSHDKGKYNCRITEEATSCATSAESPPLDLHMFMIPSLSIKAVVNTSEKSAAALNVTIDDVMTLICDVKSASPPVSHYRWTLVTSTETRLFGETTYALKLSPLSMSSSGVYECQAFNDEDFEGQIPPGRATITISVFYLTNMVLAPRTDMPVQEGESFSISCRVDSFPVAKITWYHDRHKRRYVHFNIDNYVVNKANTSHSGNYTCLATHEDKRIHPLQKSLMIDVLFHTFVKMMAKVNQKDVNIVEDQETHISEGNTLTLTCEVVAPFTLQHSHFFNWTFSAKGSSQVHHLRVEGETLTFDRLTRNASGQYTCQAWSDTNDKCQMQTEKATANINVIVSFTAEDKTMTEFHNHLAALAVIPVVILPAVVIAVVVYRRKTCTRHPPSQTGSTRNSNKIEMQTPGTQEATDNDSTNASLLDTPSQEKRMQDEASESLRPSAQTPGQRGEYPDK